jgi:hypothetical protein
MATVAATASLRRTLKRFDEINGARVSPQSFNTDEWTGQLRASVDDSRHFALIGAPSKLRNAQVGNRPRAWWQYSYA